jgi:hypothetical protein
LERVVGLTESQIKIEEKTMSAGKHKYDGINPLERLNPGEPWFFIRAQDRLSVDAVIEYSHLLRREANKASMRNEYDLSDSLSKQAAEVLEFAQNFADWQKENSDLVKYPD